VQQTKMRGCTSLSMRGHSPNDTRAAINSSSNEGHIYSTIDELHYQYAA
jgi:hypothetical protein